MKGRRSATERTSRVSTARMSDLSAASTTEESIDVEQQMHERGGSKKKGRRGVVFNLVAKFRRQCSHSLWPCAATEQARPLPPDKAVLSDVPVELLHVVLSYCSGVSAARFAACSSSCFSVYDKLPLAQHKRWLVESLCLPDAMCENAASTSVDERFDWREASMAVREAWRSLAEVDSPGSSTQKYLRWLEGCPPDCDIVRRVLVGVSLMPSSVSAMLRATSRKNQLTFDARSRDLLQWLFSPTLQLSEASGDRCSISSARLSRTLSGGRLSFPSPHPSDLLQPPHALDFTASHCERLCRLLRWLTVDDETSDGDGSDASSLEEGASSWGTAGPRTSTRGTTTLRRRLRIALAEWRQIEVLKVEVLLQWTASEADVERLEQTGDHYDRQIGALCQLIAVGNCDDTKIHFWA